MAKAKAEPSDPALRMIELGCCSDDGVASLRNPGWRFSPKQRLRRSACQQLPAVWHQFPVKDMLLSGLGGGVLLPLRPLFC
jgi:hypothetical protein